MLCSGTNPDLVVHDLPTLQHLSSSTWKVELEASDFDYDDGSDGSCFMGIDDELVIAGSTDKNLYIWSLPDAKGQNCAVDQPLCVLPGHEDVINCVRYSNESSSIISCDEGGVIKLWSLPSVN